MVDLSMGVHSLNALAADWKIMLAMGGVATAAILMIAYAFSRPAVDPEEAERRRRLHLNQVGRIAEGQVLDLAEQAVESDANRKRLFRGSRPAKNLRPRQMVSYSYAISGVIYHTGQDITGLESQVRFDRLVAGQPASVKYDPSNPTDSILVADDWSGLR
jgi:hypothetical protein